MCGELQVCGCIGGDHIHSNIVVGKLEGLRDITLRFVDLPREDLVEKDFIEKYRNRNFNFTQLIM